MSTGTICIHIIYDLQTRLISNVIRCENLDKNVSTGYNFKQGLKYKIKTHSENKKHVRSYGHVQEGNKKEKRTWVSRLGLYIRGAPEDTHKSN